ncbi:MAG: glutamine synthetase III [Lentisphaeria bacterium]
MSQRKHALAKVASRIYTAPVNEKLDVSKIYGENVYSLATMREDLSKPVYQKLLATISKGEPLPSEIADEVANAMKRWAISKGATHYTHWFQPLTGTTAEKHDSFIEPDHEGGVELKFNGKNLVQGEPDASSFPNGGLRATFEARGYTAWDPTSPAFIKESKIGSTLCIPTVFCSYTGDSLDKKTPLMRSIQALDKQVKRFLACFGEAHDKSIKVSVGLEQEYFLIDKTLYMSRPDLAQCGRTLFGARSAKHQQMDDHYFGAIRPRILAYMEEVDKELWKLGIPAKTRHNEVAPAQFEIAPVFETANWAVDQNMLIMETLKQVAERHGLVCLLHEKPFQGVNGSGKHNNWSVVSPGGVNLLEPGKNPHDNARFLTFLCAVIKAVNENQDLLRMTVASAGNDHRLGANEAPPAIVSIFLGDQLYDIIEQLENGGAVSSKAQSTLHVGVDALPVLPKDTSDRNRTSPFAFTGNKFEFRAVGSNQSAAGANTVLNTIVASALDYIATELEGTPADKFNQALQDLLQKMVIENKRILFNGDNYSDAWKKEAVEKRGLLNLVTAPEAFEVLKAQKNIELFAKYNVLSPIELHSRYEVHIETYHQVIEIEGQLSCKIAKTMILPVALEYLNKLVSNLTQLNALSLGHGTKVLRSSIESVGTLVDTLGEDIEVMEKALASHQPAKIIVAMKQLRSTVDSLELVVDDEKWPLAKYSELLFCY